MEVQDERDKALELKAIEYERRLSELNHAHEKAEADRHQFVTVQVYESTQRDIRALLEVQRVGVDKATNTSDSNSKEIARITNTLTWITRTIVGAVLIAIVAFFLRPPIPVTLP